MTVTLIKPYTEAEQHMLSLYRQLCAQGWTDQDIHRTLDIITAGGRAAAFTAWRDTETRPHIKNMLQGAIDSFGGGQ
ncbi:hypothetical protein [Streptacidiphilus sp. PAMC 29251]